MPTFIAKSKHKLLFRIANGENPSAPKYLGDIISYTDSEQFRISSELLITKTVKLNDQKFTENNPTFLFSISSKSISHGSEILNFFKHLFEHRTQAGFLIFDSSGSTGLLTAIDKNDYAKIGSEHGFKLIVLNLINPISKINKIVIENTTVNPQLYTAQKYNELIRDKDTRHLSQIFHLRNLNNWIKTELFRYAVLLFPDKKVGLNVIDYGCGKGGDINKWLKTGKDIQRYVGIDIAKESLKDFVNRLLSPTMGKKQEELIKFSHLICADMGSASLTNSQLEYHTWKNGSNSTWNVSIPLTVKDQFDLASCQFAMHYMFQTSIRANHFFAQVSKHLKENGLYVCTTIDCRIISEMILDNLHGERADENDNNLLSQGLDLVIKNDLGHKLLKISFENEMWQRLVHIPNATNVNDGLSEDLFGIQYNFSLLDNESELAVDAPEWIVPLGEPLAKLAGAHGMRLIKNINFHEFIMSKPEAERLKSMDRFRIFNRNGTISQGEWDIARLYTILIFKKSDLIDTNSTDKDHKQFIAMENMRSRSPESPPPIITNQMRPRSPDSPPPIISNQMRPRSPDSPPPMIMGQMRPRSPDSPPPMIIGQMRPRSPDSPPPMIIEHAMRPRLPDSPPPMIIGQMRPRSPDSPPPIASKQTRPRSPDSPPPILSNTNEEDDDDEEMMRIIQVRNIAIELAGGEDRWNTLEQDETEYYMIQANLKLNQ
eukprot:gene4115-5866_t